MRKQLAAEATDNDIATALIASMRRAGVLGRRYNGGPETIAAVDRHLQCGLEYRLAFTPCDERRGIVQRQGKRVRKLVYAKLGIVVPQPKQLQEVGK